MIVTGHRIYSSGAEELKTQVDRQRQFHEKNMEHYSKAREAYLKKIEETVEFLKKEGLSGTAKVAADKVMEKVEDAKKLPGYVSSNAKVRLSGLLCCSAILILRQAGRVRDAQGLIDDRQALAQVVLDKVSSAWDNLQEYPAGALTLPCLCQRL